MNTNKAPHDNGGIGHMLPNGGLNKSSMLIEYSNAVCTWCALPEYARGRHRDMPAWLTAFSMYLLA